MKSVKFEALMSKATATKAKLIEGAMQALSQHGIAGTTTRKIAEMSGQQVSALHYHFKDKDELLFAVLEEVAQLLNRHLDEELKPVPDLVQCVEALIRAVWLLMQRTRELQILQFEMTFYAVRHADAAWLAEKQYKGLLAQYERFLSERQASRVDGSQLKILAQFVIAGLDGILVQELACPDEVRSKDSLDCLIRAAKAMARQMISEVP
jgi:AcrR family transcriptional regulator